MLFSTKLSGAGGFIVLLMLTFLCTSATLGTYKEPYRVKTVVIDPGHGGHDSGCLGSSSKEKQIALEVALKLGDLISKKYPDVNVIYTRKTDEFIELHERAAIANRNHADLFICIHCNSGAPAAFGAETYVMGLHKTEDNLNVAKRENSSVLYEKDYKQKYDGFDPNSPEANIIFTLYQNAYLTQSLKFASAVQRQFEEYAGRYNRGVKQAGFLVLYRTAMPSVLIETGFLTNKTDEKYLLSEKGQQAVAGSIFRAFMAYKIDMEHPGSKEKENATADIDLKKEQPIAITPDDNDNTKTKSQETKNDTPSGTPVNNKNSEKSNPIAKDSAKNGSSSVIKKETEPKIQPVKAADVKNTTPKTEVKTEQPPTPEKSSVKSYPDLFYTVQVAAVQPEVLESEIKKFSMLDVQTFKAENGMIRICNGVYTNYNKAIEAQMAVRKKGFSDAFVTPYYKGKRISVKEATTIKK
ncbi:MAG: N-acetylmuramoyl-L-alanine amidase [Bacteroidetes bacterium]|nr:N-acetylmuramoyl-L-alanine amidase [Bacteroidota bacterium]